MSHKRKRAWSVVEPSSRAPLKNRIEAREEREEYKRARVERLMDVGVTLEDWECMREHPGKYCGECNPRLRNPSVEETPKVKKESIGSDGEEEEDDGSSDEEGASDESEGYESADLSEPWSDGSGDSEGRCSLTYSEIFREEEEEARTREHWELKIALVDKLAKRLETLDGATLRQTPIGGLRGRWELYNLGVRPQPGDYSFASWLFITDDAVEGRLPSRERMTHSPYESFIEWRIRDQDGEVAPFPLPTHPSLEGIPIVLMMGPTPDVEAEMVFLGSDKLLFRIPRSLLFPDEPDETGLLMEFAGFRRTEAEMARRQEGTQTRESSSPGHSPEHYLGGL